MSENAGRFNLKAPLMAKNHDPARAALAQLQASPPPVALPVLIAGPTASGKSGLALWLAQAQGRVIINADALQVHDTWQVLSARPDAEDCARAPHFLYGTVTRGQDWSVGHWLRALRGVMSDHPNPVIVGGTGLYFRALTEGLSEIPPTPPALRADADRRLRDEGLGALLAELDPATRARIDPQNPARVQRAWEVLRATGEGLASWQARTPAPDLPIAKATAYALQPDVDWLNQRIDSRFEQMIALGALDEARAALPYWDATQLWAKAIGAPELIAHLQGKISLSQAIQDAKLATRRYAKRQRTWLRARMKGWTPLS